MSRRIAVFVGTRPEIVKMAPLVKRILRESWAKLLFVHTGQHYDWALSASFIQELDLPDPDHFLKVGSFTHGVQTARIMEKTEKIVIRERPDMVLVEGDTNSVLGVSLACVKLKIPVAHVEAGCRCFDRTMPEEINRVIVADCASIHFAATQTCVENLKREGVDPKSVYLTGHPIVDLVRGIRSSIRTSRILSKLGVRRRKYALLTVHREENVENASRLKSIIQAMQEVDTEVVFPVHPRTKKSLTRFRIPLGDLLVTKPLGYLDTLNLLQNAYLVFTDSGGIQQEACILKTPCVTLRERTEWAETVRCGVNLLAGSTTEGVISAYGKIKDNEKEIRRKFLSAENIFGRGDAASRIEKILKRELVGTGRKY